MRTNGVHAGDYLDDDAAILDMTDDGGDFLSALALEAISEREFADTAEYEKFMSDPLVIEIHRTGDKNAPPLVPVGVNGRQRWLPRGVKIRLQRFFVERLAQSQETSFATKKNNDDSRDSAMDTIATRSAAYQFNVLHDPHPKGRAWLERMMRSGT